MKKVEANNFDIKLSGASDLNAEIANLAKVTVRCSGASFTNLSGTCTDIIIELSGASQFRSFDFVTDTADVEISGASQVEITANKSISGSASGASIVRFSGDATSSVDVSDASTVSHR